MANVPNLVVIANKNLQQQILDVLRAHNRIDDEQAAVEKKRGEAQVEWARSLVHDFAANGNVEPVVAKYRDQQALEKKYDDQKAALVALKDAMDTLIKRFMTDEPKLFVEIAEAYRKQLDDEKQKIRKELDDEKKEITSRLKNAESDLARLTQKLSDAKKLLPPAAPAEHEPEPAEPKQMKRS